MFAISNIYNLSALIDKSIKMKKCAQTISLAMQSLASTGHAKATCDKIPANWKAESNAQSANLCAEVLIKADDEGTRKLWVFESGKLAFENDDAALCKSCGAVKGNPFQSVELSNQTLVATNWGGSRYAWGETWKIAKRHGNWQLIGWERNALDGLTGSDWSESVNALTRKAIVEYQPGENADCGEVKESNLCLQTFKTIISNLPVFI